MRTEASNIGEPFTGRKSARFVTAGPALLNIHVVALSSTSPPKDWPQIVHAAADVWDFRLITPLDSAAVWLDDALRELDGADQEAEEEGAGPISQLANDNARRVLEALARRYRLLPGPAVYPTEDKEIAIFFRDERTKSAILILCDSDGGGACFSSISGENRRARYDDAGDLPDGFVKDELLRLQACSSAPAG